MKDDKACGIVTKQFASENYRYEPGCTVKSKPKSTPIPDGVTVHKVDSANPQDWPKKRQMYRKDYRLLESLERHKQEESWHYSNGKPCRAYNSQKGLTYSKQG